MTMLKDKIKNLTCKAVKTEAHRNAVKNANSTCIWLKYQSEQPESVKKLRKF